MSERGVRRHPEIWETLPSPPVATESAAKPVEDSVCRPLNAAALALAGDVGQLRGGSEEKSSFSKGVLCFSVGGNSREKGRGMFVARRLLCVEGFSANQSGTTFLTVKSPAS